MKTTIISVVIAAVVMFLIGRFTSPEHNEKDTREIDSLRKVNAQMADELVIAKRLVTEYHNKAVKNYELAKEAQSRKPIYTVVYENQVKRNLSYTESQLDSAIRAIYPDSLMARPANPQ